MNKNSLLEIYDHTYAEKYNYKFITNPVSKTSADFEINVLDGLIHADTSWLDVGCGTGYFLSRFPGRSRAGLDISPGMLQEAKKANPDALFFREGNFCDDIPEWKEQWSLVSSMWYPYSYLDSLAAVEKMIMNLVKWAKPGGCVFLPVADLEDLRPAMPQVPYDLYEDVYAGTVILTSYTWTWVEDDDHKTHVNMIAPHIEHVVRLLQPFFEELEIIRYPPVYDGWVSRKAVLGKRKIKADAGPGHKATVIRHPVPAPAIGKQKPVLPPAQPNPLGSASFRQIAAELAKRFNNRHTYRLLIKRLLNI